MDFLAALTVFSYTLPILPQFAADPSRFGALVAVAAALCMVYLLRRRWALAAYAVMLAAAWLHSALGAVLIPADIMLLLGLYHVAAHAKWPLSLAAGAGAIIWLCATVFPQLDALFLGIGDFGLLLVSVVWVWTWGTLVRTRRAYIAGLQERTRQLEREQAAQAQMAVAEERARIAREIHDIVSHSLGVMVVLSEGAAAKLDTEPERARSAVLTVRDTGRSALTEMRRVLNMLQSGEPGPHAPQPGVAQLRELTEASAAAGLPVTLTVQGDPVPLPAGLDLTVYRTVQEALTNVRKHAGPIVSHAEVRLRFSESAVEVRVTDDGQGTHCASGPPGYGLIGMRERVTAYGGALETGLRPSGGFEVRATLPLEGRA